MKVPKYVGLSAFSGLSKHQTTSVKRIFNLQNKLSKNVIKIVWKCPVSVFHIFQNWKNKNKKNQKLENEA